MGACFRRYFGIWRWFVQYVLDRRAVILDAQSNAAAEQSFCRRRALRLMHDRLYGVFRQYLCTHLLNAENHGVGSNVFIFRLIQGVLVYFCF